MSVFLQMLHQSSVLSNITLLYFFSSKITYFGQKEPIKVQIFGPFECSGQNSSNCDVNFETASQFLVKLCIIFHVHVNLIHFLLSIKGPIKVPILRISSALVKNCLKLLMSFSNSQDSFLQILHVMKFNSSVPFQLKHILCSKGAI